MKEDRYLFNLHLQCLLYSVVIKTREIGGKLFCFSGPFFKIQGFFPRIMSWSS